MVPWRNLKGNVAIAGGSRRGAASGASAGAARVPGRMWPAARNSAAAVGCRRAAPLRDRASPVRQFPFLSIFYFFVFLLVLQNLIVKMFLFWLPPDFVSDCCHIGQMWSCRAFCSSGLLCVPCCWCKAREVFSHEIVNGAHCWRAWAVCCRLQDHGMCSDAWSGGLCADLAPYPLRTCRAHAAGVLGWLCLKPLNRWQNCCLVWVCEGSWGHVKVCLLKGWLVEVRAWRT